MRVSRQSRLRDAYLVTGFPYTEKGRHLQNRYFSRFILETQAIRRTGCASIDLCYTAAGIFDGFWEFNLKPWDLSAGVLFVEESGGRISDLRGGPCKIESGEVTASNGRIHKAMLKILGSVR
jgi:myo-inositol-1(or 4)-monophosphatase